ncbi:MAG: molybdopterin-dependent oxidoreductase [Geminicoccaceae bacterium]
MSAFHATVCPHDCPSVCTLQVERTGDGRMGKVRGSKINPYTAGVVCNKVSRYAERYHHDERLTFPMRRKGERGSGDFERIGWDDALDLVAEGLARAEQAHGSETVWPYWYAGTMGFVQRDGINRLTHAKRWSRFDGTICTRLADTGWKAGYGKLWGVPCEEAGGHSDLIIVWGCNPVATHVNLMNHISRARKRGAQLVVVDPYRTGTAAQADIHVALRPGTDGALACAMMHVLFRENLVDRAHLEARTDAPADLEAHLQHRSPEWAAPITGLSVEDITALALLYGRTEKAWIRFGFGFTRSRNGSAAMHAVSCLPVVTGKWQTEGGGGLYNMRDVYGWDKTMIEGHDVRDLSTRLLDQSRIGPILTGDRNDLGDGPEVTALFIQNTNPMCVAPDLGLVHRGFARSDLFVAVQEQFMTETAKQADVLLPATMFVEHDDIYHASAHSRFQIGRKIFEPHGECRSNHHVVCELAKRLGAEHPGFAMSEIELIEDLLARSGWPDVETVQREGGFEALSDIDRAHHRGGYPTADGKFRFRPDWKALGDVDGRMPALPDHLEVTDEKSDETPFRLVAAPARQFLNTSFTELASGRSREERPRARIHPDVMARLGIVDGDRVKLANNRGEVTLPAVAAPGQHEDTIVVESIWPNAYWEGGVGINILLSADRGLPGGGAAIHDTAVRMTKAA